MIEKFKFTFKSFYIYVNKKNIQVYVTSLLLFFINCLNKIFRWYNLPSKPPVGTFILHLFMLYNRQLNSFENQWIVDRPASSLMKLPDQIECIYYNKFTTIRLYTGTGKTLDTSKTVPVCIWMFLVR